MLAMQIDALVQEPMLENTKFRHLGKGVWDAVPGDKEDFGQVQPLI